MIITQKDKKEIIYRSVHRGCKETDFLIGEFVVANIDNLMDNDLALLKKFILEDDLMIYEWILKKKNPFAQYSGLVEKMREFHSIS